MTKISFKIISLIATMIVLVVFVFTSCQKEELEIAPSGTPEYAETEANLALQELTDLFLEASNSDNFLSELKRESLIEYQDDYLLKSSNLKSSKSDKQIIRLLKQYSKDLDFERIQELVDKIPNYEVSVPVNAEEWDENSYQPLIAFIPSDFNEKIHKKIKAFDVNGKEKWLSIDEDPVLPVILIRPKEDIDLTNYVPDNGTSLKSSRVNGYLEFVKQIGTDDIGAVESWITGPRCEIKVITISSKTGSIISTDYFDPKRKEIKNSYHTVNHKIDKWDKNTYGEYWTMQWFEEDGGGTTTASVKYKTEDGHEATLSYSIKDKDDDLGLKTVHFTDYVGMAYNTGRIKWKNNNSTYCPYIGSYDGANCKVGTPPSGTTAFIYNHRFYYTDINGSCPYPGSWFDGANCYVTAIPSSADPFIYNNRWYVQPYNF